jgi:site-specific recombinase XerD
MRFVDAIDRFVEDMRMQGRINSDRTEERYRRTLELHNDDVNGRDPSLIGREDIKTTLRRWQHPNTQAVNRAVLVSFYDWAMEEGHRKDNPARQVRRPKRRPADTYRLTQTEAAAILTTARGDRETRIAYLGICAGIRNQELRLMQGRHFRRPGFVWVSRDIAKGGRERWVPIIEELAPIADQLSRLADDHHVLPRSKAGGFSDNSFVREDPTLGMSSQTVQRTVHRLAKRAGIAAHVHPHLLRHAFADHVARYAGLKNAQQMLGHADVSTTQGYVGKATLEELAEAVRGLRFTEPTELTFPTPREMALEGAYGEGGIRTLGPDLPSAFKEVLEHLAPAARVALYRDHFLKEAAR